MQQLEAIDQGVPGLCTELVELIDQYVTYPMILRRTYTITVDELNQCLQIYAHCHHEPCSGCCWMFVFVNRRHPLGLARVERGRRCLMTYYRV